MNLVSFIKSEQKNHYKLIIDKRPEKQIIHQGSTSLIFNLIDIENN